MLKAQGHIFIPIGLRVSSSPRFFLQVCLVSQSEIHRMNLNRISWQRLNGIPQLWRSEPYLWPSARYGGGGELGA